MKQLSLCQQAKQFKRVNGFFVPCEYPCDDCPKKKKHRTCKGCGAIWMQRRDVPLGKLKAPDVEMRDFEMVLKNSCASVTEDQIEDYEQWTKEFGESET